MLSPLEISKIVIETLDSKKATDIKLLKTTDVTTLADYFVICTATSTTQLKALSDEVDEVLKDKGEAVLRREGHRKGDWVLLDYACVVVHLFLKEARDFYTLERIWSDAEDVDISDIIQQ
jgi:ribosome-associated protein